MIQRELYTHSKHIKAKSSTLVTMSTIFNVKHELVVRTIKELQFSNLITNLSDLRKRKKTTKLQVVNQQLIRKSDAKIQDK